MTNLTHLIKFIIAVRQFLPFLRLTNYCKRYFTYQTLVKRLVSAERALTQSNEHSYKRYKAIRTDAIILRQVIEHRSDAYKFDFLIDNLNSISLRCNTKIKNIEFNTRNNNYLLSSNLNFSSCSFMAVRTE